MVSDSLADSQLLVATSRVASLRPNGHSARSLFTILLDSAARQGGALEILDVLG